MYGVPLFRLKIPSNSRDITVKKNSNKKVMEYFLNYFSRYYGVSTKSFFLIKNILIRGFFIAFTIIWSKE